MNIQEIQELAKYGVGGLVAGFIFLWYRRDMIDRIESMQRARVKDAELLTMVTAALDRSTEAHEKAIEESARNRQLFNDLRAELRAWRESGTRRKDDAR